jgi:hypothetical protein
VLPLADLRADCSRCRALCCVVPGFTRSSEFAFDKPPGTPCRHIAADFRCGIHADLRERGMSGCTVFDCFGAGQRVTATTADWRDLDPGEVFDAFVVVHRLHELLWYLADALSRPETTTLYAELHLAADRLDTLAGGLPHELAVVDLGAEREAVDGLLRSAGALVRRGTHGPDHERGDLAGRMLRGADLRGANLRGVSLIGADLSGADLRRADVIGADFRGANLSGADLGDALFVTQVQVNGAHGDAATRIPRPLARPSHWSAEPVSLTSGRL